MPEIRFTITEKLNKHILSIANHLGVDKSDYVKSLILSDLNKQIEVIEVNKENNQLKKREEK